MKRAIAIVVLAFVAGCSLDRPYPDKTYYTLDASPPAVAADGATRVVRVPRAFVAPPFSSRSIQYRVAPNRTEPSYYHNWADDPGALVAAAAAARLAATGALVVVAPGSDARGGETLELEVTTLAVEAGGAPRVAVALRATLLDADGAVRLSRAFERSEAASSRNASDAVQAFDAALASILDELVRAVVAAG
jgi:ABC-type uncharacterized transport system auxiliary subunit